MTLKRLPRPRRMRDELPVAKLYLDDVRDIVDIMSMKDSDSATRDPQVRYRVGEFECETLEDLEELGGSTRDFKITVLNQGRESRISIGGVLSYVRLSCPENDYSLRNEKIREIFEANSIWWKQIIRDIFDRIPYWFVIIWLAVSIAASRFDPTPIHYGNIWPGAVLIVLFFYFFLVRGSVVRLRYAHTRSPKKWFRDHATQIAFLILSAVLCAFAKEMATPIKIWIEHFWR